MKIKVLLSAILVFCMMSASYASVTLIMPNRTGNNGSQITIPVKVKDFINILGAQGTIDFNPAVLQYSSTTVGSLSGIMFGTTQTASGKLTFQWTDPLMTGVSLADSAIAFSITFNIIGTSGQYSALTFSNTPTAIEIVNTSMATEVVVPVNGSVTVATAGPVYDLTLKLDTITGAQGSSVQVSLRGVDFVNIASIQGTIKFNPSVVTFSSINYYGLPGMGSTDFNVTQAATGKIMFTWIDGTLLGINMANNAALFTMTFNLSGTAGNSTQLQFGNSPTAWEVGDSLSNSLNADTLKGRITIAPLSIGIDNETSAVVPEQTSLMQNIPNPFANITTISFTLAIEEYSTITIYNILGDKVYENADYYSKGMHSISWDATDVTGQTLPSGTYFYRLKAGDFSSTKKMIIF